MSFFTGDVIAKEQMHGVAGAPLAPAALGGDSAYYYYRKKPRGEDGLFSLVHQLLEKMAG